MQYVRERERFKSENTEDKRTDPRMQEKERKSLKWKLSGGHMLLAEHGLEPRT